MRNNPKLIDMPVTYDEEFTDLKPKKGGIEYVELTVENSTLTADHTFGEIKQAVANGKYIIFTLEDSSGETLYPVNRFYEISGLLIAPVGGTVYVSAGQVLTAATDDDYPVYNSHPGGSEW